jgi:cell division protein FtsQ
VNGQNIEDKQENHGLRYAGLLTLLIACAMLLAARLCYLFIAQPEHFPVNKVKIEASYQHITHQELEEILSPYLEAGFFALPITRLQNALNALDWVESAYALRIWPDTLKIVLIEKKPIARWGDKLVTEKGELFAKGYVEIGYDLPILKGSSSQMQEVLQLYQKLSKILESYGLHVATLVLQDNQAWDLTLTNGVYINLGKKALEKRLLRFCKAYPTVFAEKISDLVSVDLRYPRGMAVHWKQQSEK